MRSITAKLIIGMGGSGAIAGAALCIDLVRQFGLLGNSPLPYEHPPEELIRHILLPTFVFVTLFASGTALAISSIAKQLRATDSLFFHGLYNTSRFHLPQDLTPCEIRPLAGVVNDLTSKLATYAHRQEAFADDASHGLKNALAILSLSIDQLPGSESRLLRKLISVLSEKVDRSLLLSRSYASDQPLRFQPTHIDALARQVVAELAPTAIQTGKSISLAVDNPIPFSGSNKAISAALSLLVADLLSNCPEGANVNVTVGPGACFTIESGNIQSTLDAIQKFMDFDLPSNKAFGGSALTRLFIAFCIIEAEGGDLLCNTAANSPSLILTLPEWQSSQR
ncbi:hypothetical protein [Hyphomonas jannaschiana]|jgi:signal transduction histidine kinase|uniref:hypothetical protein n=1 Tax=Hyphomonas jannaschiana TaxID=86 RepID=UPI0012DC90EE|nr:hypothetical protein [Hyphomonas jannaschiana]|tara:strand:+ start:138 stop:1151 length:1014 start_codon:yes stop_codon:yes gene_type:complete